MTYPTVLFLSFSPSTKIWGVVHRLWNKAYRYPLFWIFVLRATIGLGTIQLGSSCIKTTAGCIPQTTRILLELHTLSQIGFIHLTELGATIVCLHAGGKTHSLPPPLLVRWITPKRRDWRLRFSKSRSLCLLTKLTDLYPFPSLPPKHNFSSHNVWIYLGTAFVWSGKSQIQLRDVIKR